MAVRDIFSMRRPLDSPVGVPRDFMGSTIEAPDLANLAVSPAIEARLDRDTMPIPSTRDREGYYGDRHLEYWLSGLSDYLKIKEACAAVDWVGASLLDFGGATGRVARHFYAQDDLAEVMICDVNINNVDWVLEYMPAGFAVFKNSATPSLPIPDDYFNVVTAFSVFTHMSEYELGWLYELRRILKPNGILYATIHNDDTWSILPSTWVFNVLMQSGDFRATYRREHKLTERLVFEYSSESTYNCNTFHPNAYLYRVWGNVFTVLDIRPVCHNYQSAVILRKEPRRVASYQAHKLDLEERTAMPWTAGHRTKLQDLKTILAGLSEDDLLELIPDLTDLLQRTGTEHWWMKKRVFEAFEAHGFHVTQDHFYSPQPTVASLASGLWDGSRYLNPAFAFDMERMRALFSEFTSFAAELADVPRTGPAGFYWDNNFFPNFDAIIYYGLCRRFRPAIVLEVGSGFSTHIALRAAQQNGVTQVRCIEPYPTPTLQAIGDRLSQLRVQPVQDVPLDVYRDLQSGDILFVDTSHVSKLGGDLHHILFHVLPSLPDGVLVHFRDIFLPREYPREWVIERNWFWNEQYLLLAFLMYNEAFRVVFMNNHFLSTCPHVAERALGDLDLGPLQGASMWLRKEPRAVYFETRGNAETSISFEEDPLSRDINDHSSRRHWEGDGGNPDINGLAGEPWRSTTPPTDVLNVTTMLSTSERALLYWVARDYYTGAGEIVDSGCFVGGSTLSLAHGLIDGGHVGEGPRIHVYDLFISDPYMIEHYFKPLGIEYTSGDSFRPLFDANTRTMALLLQVNQGDIRQIGWTGQPIEILFIDISKHWSINDVLLTDFFPCLMPGRSVVIQQDFVFEWCPWLALTMEYLADYFEYVAFVEHNSTVYLHTRPIPSDILHVKLWDLPLQYKVELMDRAIGRFSGYAKGMIECAKAALLLESGQASEAIDLLAGVRERYPEDHIVLRAAGGVEVAARQSLA